METTIVWEILHRVLVTVTALDMRAESTAVAGLVMVAVLKIVIEVTIVIMLHVAVSNVFNRPDLNILILLEISVIEGETQGAEVGGQRRQLLAGGGHV